MGSMRIKAEMLVPVPALRRGINRGRVPGFTVMARAAAVTPPSLRLVASLPVPVRLSPLVVTRGPQVPLENLFRDQLSIISTEPISDIYVT
ncbi:hypothetical protein EVAR_92533_1 [Eumeta japonica]|uniref:Uncharacterized protein n=1 Tax=Eumeta variegata TaxID=151549 RepID=A0A4C1T906_EUMVA|nr:hypothetical protein EVAR_92533_1 [Eumeta japonica]